MNEKDTLYTLQVYSRLKPKLELVKNIFMWNNTILNNFHVENGSTGEWSYPID